MSNRRRREGGGRSSPGARVPAALAAIPADPEQVGARTRARFRYQDECAALTLLQRLLSDDLEGIALEHSTDLVVLPKEGRPELVSVKHRDPSQRREPAWSYAELKRSGVLQHLLHEWRASGRACTVSFLSNAGFTGTARALWACRSRGLAAGPEVLDEVAQHLAVTEAEAEAFVADLALPSDPLPRLSEITDVGVRWVERFLLGHGRTAGPAEDCYAALLDRIRAASDSVAERRPQATLLAYARGTTRDELDSRYLSADEARSLLLRVHDDAVAVAVHRPRPPRSLSPDPLFAGRERLLDELASLLRPGRPEPVAPVVLHGLTGCGKSSVALQFGALQGPGVVVVDGSSRAALVQGLGTLAPEERDAGLVEPPEVALPEDPALLLIVDGVVERSVVAGLVPRASLCRVLITSTVSYLDPGFTHLPVEPWTPEEGAEYVVRAWPAAADAATGLVRALHGHPLAVVQAVNLSLQLELGPDEYLRQLERARTRVLDLGAANDHPATVYRALMLTLDAVRGRSPLAADLLVLVALLGAGGLEDALFDEHSIVMFLDGSDVGDPEGPSPLPESGALRRQLSEPDSRLAAYGVLRDFSLLSRKQGALTTHPLVAALVLDGVTDHRRYLEVALPLFSKYLSPGAVSETTAWDELGDVPRLARLLDVCRQSGVTGPGFYGFCLFVAPWLPRLGERGRALEFAEIAYEWARRSASGQPDPYRVLLPARSALATALVANGRVEQALDLLQQNLRDARQSGVGEYFLQVVQDLGQTALKVDRRDVAESALEMLPDLDPALVAQEPDRLVPLAILRAKLLWVCNRLAQADEVIRSVLHLVRARGGAVGWRIEALYVASSLARYGSGPGSAERAHEMLALVEQELGADSPTPLLVSVLIASADADIGEGHLERAEEKLVRAHGLVPGLPHRHEAEVGLSGVRGRLLFERACRAPDAGEAHFAEAIEELERTVSGIEQLPRAERGRLAPALVHLAQAKAATGRLREGVVLARRAYDLDRAASGPDHPEVVLDREVLSLLRRQLMS